AAFSQNGARIITGNEYGLSLWDSRSGALLVAPTNQLLNAGIEFEYGLSPDGRTAVRSQLTKPPKTLQLWDVLEARMVDEWPPAADATNVSFSADSRALLVFGKNGVEQREVLGDRSPQLVSPGLCAVPPGNS